MKKLLLRPLLCLVAGLTITTSLFAQWQNKSFTHQGVLRQYRVYQSPNYNASNPASMVITLHGLGDNMTNFSGIGMNYIADTANIIVVVPQAVTDALAGTAWNAGAGFMGYFPNSTIDDVHFIGTLMDTIQTNYAINPNRVYVCGFSMGAFMTNRLAIEYSDRFTAFATVSGTFGFGLTDYTPNADIRIAHFHGTADGTVPYAGNASGIGADSLVNFWVNNNQCDPVPQHIALPDTQNDGYTVDQYIYSNGTDNSSVEFFKVTGADHVWLGPSNDIFYTTEIWKFFNKYQALQGAGIEEQSTNPFTIFPNPATDQLQLASANYNGTISCELIDLTGKTILLENVTVANGNASISLGKANAKAGVYLLKVKNASGEWTNRVVIR